MLIGILDIQGSVEEHITSLKRCGITPVLVKSIADLEKISGLIIPGGESTVIGKLLGKTGLLKEIKKRASKVENGKKPLFVWGTCAGAILLAKKIIAHGAMPNSLGLMNIKIMRNAYGRQMDSFEAELDIPTLGDKSFPGIFIRAPKMGVKNGFFKPSKNVEILAHYEGLPIMAKEGNLLVTMFHPELTDDLRVHKYFISLVRPASPPAPSYARTHRTIHQKTVKNLTGKSKTGRALQNATKGRLRV